MISFCYGGGQINSIWAAYISGNRQISTNGAFKLLSKLLSILGECGLKLLQSYISAFCSLSWNLVHLWLDHKIIFSKSSAKFMCFNARGCSRDLHIHMPPKAIIAGDKSHKQNRPHKTNRKINPLKNTPLFFLCPQTTTSLKQLNIRMKQHSTY